MAKTRQQRKAEKRAKEQMTASKAAELTQTPKSGEVAEVEAVIATGAELTLDEEIRPPSPLPEGGAEASTEVVPDPVPEPKPSRAERKAARAAEREEAPAKESKPAKREAQAPAGRRGGAPVQESRRNPVIAFFASCWAELKRVQWPDRETLVQASAVTLLFVAVAAAYLGALDALFNWLIKRIL